MTEKELTVECCVRCHHGYQSKWGPKVDTELKACHETRPSALVEDKYAMTLKHKDVTVGHVPKFHNNISINKPGNTFKITRSC